MTADNPDPYFTSRRLGPYGTNEGDIWSGEHSEVGKMLMRDGCVLIHEMMRNEETGEIEERLYNVKLNNPDMQIQSLIKQAREGTKLWVAAQAAQN